MLHEVITVKTVKTGLQQQDHRGDIIGVNFTPYMNINTCAHKGGPIQPDILFFASTVKTSKDFSFLFVKM